MPHMLVAAPRMWATLLVLSALSLFGRMSLAEDKIERWPHPHEADGTVRKVELDRYDSLGGEFALTSKDGQTVRLSDFRSRVVLLYFGYTHCRDSCPLTAAKVAQVMHSLGEQREHVRFLLISTDPVRDTAQRLGAWLSSFDPQFMGLRGDAAQLAAVEKQYGVFHTKLPLNSDDGSYDVNHTSRLFLIDQRGHVRYLFTPDQPAESIVEGVRLLLTQQHWLARLLRFLRK